MKKSEILTQINEIVKSYMNDGCQLYWGNSSYGYEFMVELVKGLDKIRVYAENKYSTYNSEKIETLEIKVVEMRLEQDFEEKDRPAIFHKAFFKITDNWFTEDINEAFTAAHKHFEHYKNRQKNTNEKEISATESFIGKIKNHKGFEKATLKNITITKSDKCYLVTIKNRNERITERITFQLMSNKKAA